MDYKQEKVMNVRSEQRSNIISLCKNIIQYSKVYYGDDF